MSAAQWTAEVTIDPATGEASLSLGAYDALGRPVEVSEEDLAKFRALALAAALEPPGLARNRRARETWLAQNSEARRRHREYRVSGRWWPLRAETGQRQAWGYPDD
jgi:hypothetical protein